MKQVLWLPALLALYGLPGPVHAADSAATAQAPAVRFQVRDIVLQGATRLPEAEWRAIVAPVVGREIGFADLEAVRAAIEARYHAHGWRLAGVRIPPQALDGGVVRMEAVEPVLAAIQFPASTQRSEARWHAMLPALREGEMPDLSALDRQLTLANENPGLQVQVAFTNAPDGLRAQVQAQEPPAGAWTAFLDNTGNAQTGHLRSGLAWNHGNVWGLDHQLQAQFVSAPHDEDHPDRLSLLPSRRVRIFGLGYRVPMPAHGAALDLAAGHSDVDSGTVQDVFRASGQGTTLSARYSALLDRIEGWQPRWTAGAEWRRLDSQLLFNGVNLAVPIELHPVSLGLAAQRPPTPQQPQAYRVHGTFVANVPGGSHGDQASFTASRAGATAHYKLLRFGGQAVAPAAGWQFSATLDAQWTRDLLVAAEQIAAGGASSVRGFTERGISGDSGARAQLEAESPNWLQSAADPRTRITGVLFTDGAWTRRNRPAALELSHASIASVGAGLRGNWQDLNWRLEVAKAVHQHTGSAPVWGAVHFSVAIHF